MSPLNVTWRRTMGRARNLYSVALGYAGFLALSGGAFALGLEHAGGSGFSLAVTWASSMGPILPALVAFLAMDVWSDERQSGRIDLLLAAPVRERTLMLGKFMGVWTLTALGLVFSLGAHVLALWLLAPEVLAGTRLLSLLPGLMGLLLQGALWTSVALACSAATSRASTALCTTLVLTMLLPRGLWRLIMFARMTGHTSLGEMPLDAHLVDWASGLLPVGTTLGYFVCLAIFLFVATKRVMMLRCVGRKGRLGRASALVAIVLALIFGGVAQLVLQRVTTTLELPIASVEVKLSPSMRRVLADSSGDITATLFLSRTDAAFGVASRLLRTLAREARQQGGARFHVSFVDPQWDFAPAERLVRRGVAPGCVVFENARRISSVPCDRGLDERACASAILRFTTRPPRSGVYWTFGHGESRFDDYGPFGLSDLARDFVREGYANHEIDLASEKPIPADCAFIVLAGAKYEFSRAEIGRLDAYLREGGRLLVLQDASGKGGISALLPTWGMNVAVTPLVGARTLTGTDVIVTEFSPHIIAASLRGGQLVLERPVTFTPSTAVTALGGAERLAFTALVSQGGHALAAIVERGASVGRDVALRPTRIVAIGDTLFAMNGTRLGMAGANRDFLLNCAAYLAGVEIPGGSECLDMRASAVGLDRLIRLRYAVTVAGILPLVTFCVFALLILRRRNRK